MFRATLGNPFFLVAGACTFMRVREVISIQKQEESIVYLLGWRDHEKIVIC
jgi:hypothetical protein